MTKFNSCPCCGYRTLQKQAPGTYQICPVCFWEDTKNFFEWGTNSISLSKAQHGFSEMGACQEKWISYVRPPTISEERPADWKTLEENRDVYKQKVIQSIKKAFDGVELEDGITLFEARLIDDYMFSKSEKENSKIKRLKQQKENNLLFMKYGQFGSLSLDVFDNNFLQNWQYIPDKVVEKFDDVLVFLDKKGYRFYLPSYMIWTINFFDRLDTNNNSAKHTIFSLVPSDFNLSQQQILTLEQSKAICKFVRFMAIYDDYEEIEDLGLLEYWSQFCQPLLINEVYYRYDC